MNRAEKLAGLKRAFAGISEGGALESLVDRGLESTGDPREIPGQKGLEKLSQNQDANVSDVELDAMEAIILPKLRPVTLIRNGAYEPIGAPWTGLNAVAVRQRLEPLFASIGRIELPQSVLIPYAGTGFVVGPDLLMTNRHVAQIFTDGLGARELRFRAGEAAIDFKREAGDPDDDRANYIEVREVVMIHPYWDMALLRVAGLPKERPSLRLGVHPPEELAGREIAVIGYPARDPRNDSATQDEIFKHMYNVKRFQPGKARAVEKVQSFENLVGAVTHDASTLGGNSGSAVIDVATGEVLGLHFSGVYLKANFAVPMHGLARDPRVVALGLGFTGDAPADPEIEKVWRQLDGERPVVNRPPQPQQPTQPTGRPAEAPAVNFTIPLTITVSLGQPTQVAGGVSVATGAVTAAQVEAPRSQVPIMDPDESRSNREGYQPEWLSLPGGDVVPLPELTTAGLRAAAKLEDGSTELTYHHYSVVIHKRRRLALFTASNVDWRQGSRLIDGHKPSRKELTGLADGQQEQWVTDPRIPDAHQLPDIFFTKDDGAFDKGHLVRRDDVCWGGSLEEIQYANGDTFHTTNCSPQVAGFNRSAEGDDNWGDLENLVQKQTKAERVCVFSGPVLDGGDRFFKGRDLRGPVSVQIPRSFWKIVVAKGASGPEAYGFMLEQDLSGVPLSEEFVVPAPWKRYLVSIADIEEALGGLARLTWLKQHDRFQTDEGRELAVAVRTTVQATVR